MDNLANTYREEGRYDEAEALGREALEIDRRVLGEEHPETLESMNNLGKTYTRQGRFEEAEALMREALGISRRAFGEDNRTTNDARRWLACYEALRGHRDEAISYLREALDHGYDGHRPWILDDPDLASLHGDPEVEAIALEMKRRREEVATAEPATETR